MLQPDGRILVAASVVDPAAQATAAGIARFMPNGTPDPSFDSDGFKYIRSGSYSSAYDVKLDRGRIYLAGTTGDQGVGDDSFLVSRLLPSGSLDTSFGGSGVVRTRTRTPTDGRFNFIKFAEMIIDSRGRPVIAGDAGDHIALVRYQAR